MASENTILMNVLDKLDKLPIDFNISDIDIKPALDDTLREISVVLDNVEVGSNAEFNIELRTEYWMLHRLKNSETINFKFSTSIDGRTVDKSMIPTVIQSTMDDLDDKFKTFMSHSSFNKPASGIWNVTARTSTRLT